MPIGQPIGFSDPSGHLLTQSNPYGNGLDIYGTGGTQTPSSSNLVPLGGMQGTDAANNFLDNPNAAVNNIMQQMGLSVSSNNPFYQRMEQLAPGLGWLQYFGGSNGSPTSFLGNVGNWFSNGASGGNSGFPGASGLSSIFGGILGGGGTPEASAMLDNMHPNEIAQALVSMIETGDYGSYGSKMRQGLESKVSDLYNVFLGQQPNIEAGLSGAETLGGSFLGFLKNNNLLGSLGL